MFSNSDLTIRFLVGAVVVALLLLLAVGGGTGFVAVLYLNNAITSLSADFAALSGPGREHALQTYQQAQAAFSYFLMACVAIAVVATVVCLATYFAVRNGILGPPPPSSTRWGSWPNQNTKPRSPDWDAPTKSACWQVHSRSSRPRVSSASA